MQQWKIILFHLTHDGGKEHTINLDWEDEGEVEKQGGCIPQKHLQA